MGNQMSIRTLGGFAILLVTALFLRVSEGVAQSRVAVTGSIHTDGRLCPLMVGNPCQEIPSEPIERALITIRDLRGRFIVATRSRSDGSFAFKLKRGNYILAAPRFRHKERIRVRSEALFLFPIVIRR